MNKNIRHLFFIFFTFFNLTIVQNLINAATITSNVVTANWSLTTTWVGGVVPIATDDVIIADGAQISVNAAAACNNLTIGQGAANTRLTGTAVAINIGGNVIINTLGNFRMDRATVIINGLVDVYGTLSDGHANGSEVFNNNVAVHSSGNIVLTANATATFKSQVTIEGGFIVTGPATVYFENSIVNNGTVNFSSGGSTCAFRTNNQTISGSGTISATKMDIQGAITVINQNSNTITITNTLNGTVAASTWVNDNTSHLIYQGAAAPMSTGTLNASTTSNTVTYNLAGAQAIKGTNYYNLIIDGGNTKTLGANTSVFNNLTMTNGNIDAGLNTLTLGNSNLTPGTLNYVSGTIIGKFERWISNTESIYYPIGTATNLNDFSINIISGLTQGSLILEFIAANPGSVGLPLISEQVDAQFTEGYWNLIANNSFECTNYNVALKATGFISYTIDEQTRVIKRTNGGAWSLDGTHIAAISPNCFRNGMNGISNIGTQLGIARSVCVAATISNQPVSVIICDLDNALFSVTASGTGLVYQWQESTNGGSTWNNINDVGVYSNSSSSTLNITGAPLSMHNYQYRCVLNTGCDTYSSSATLNVYSIPTTQSTKHKENNY